MNIPKKYKKSALRETLERNMRLRRSEPELAISPMEFSRWLKIYVDKFNLPEDICHARTLEEPVVDSFGAWLGDALR